jgi:phosphatidylglycerol:prolipoprotein diacylglycerol transferase
LYPVLVGAVIGARLWYGLFNLDLYGRNLGLFVALHVSDLAWPGALLGGILVGSLWCSWKRFDALALADSAALTLPVVQAIASVGLLLSGEAFGVPTDLPWGVPLFGAVRHPTQIYLALASLGSLLVILRLARRHVPVGALWISYLSLQGLTLLVFEALRADSLVLPGGIRAAQVFGLALLLYSVSLAQRHSRTAPPKQVETSGPMLHEQS